MSGPAPIPSELRFWKFVDVGGEDECWPWMGAYTGGRDGKSYGTFARCRTEPGRRMVYAHRMAYCLSHGIDPGWFPREIVVRHKCDNAKCCNPKHLEPGTQADNVDDKVQRGRVLRGEEIHNSILRREDVLLIKQRLAQGDFHRLIAEDFGVRRGSISGIAAGRSWAWVTAPAPA